MARGPDARGISIPLLERPRLIELASKQQAPFEVVRRARMIQLLAEGLGPTEVARQLGCTARNVHKWRARWEQHPAIESLQDGCRSGRPREISMEDRCEVIKMACDRPDKLYAPFRDVWTQGSLAQALVACGVTMSRSSVCRILNAEGIRPHKVRPWLHSPDPDFKPKVKRICDLYRDAPKGTVVLCVDEKPMQALERSYATTRGPDGSVRPDYEYGRRGVNHLLAALNVQTGRVHGRVVPKRDGNALVSFMNEVARAYRGKKVYVIWDNLNIHYDGKDERWTTFNARHGGRFEFVYTPVHASWVNQVEQWFSILQRRVLRHGSFDHLARLKLEVEAFIRWWNAHEKKPFRWTFDGTFRKTQARAA